MLRAWIEDLHLEDIRLDLVVAEARALLERAVDETRVLIDRTDTSVLRSAFARASVASRINIWLESRRRPGELSDNWLPSLFPRRLGP